MTKTCHNLFPTISQVKGVRKIARKRKRQNQGTPNKAPFVKNFGSIIYETDESELILQSHFHFRY